VELRINNPNEDGVGEVVARSPGNMNEYWGAADVTVLDEDGWLHTGDLGRIRDGHLQIVGRSKDVIVRAGENVASPHVESCLLSHPEVHEVAVFGLDDEDLGEEVAAVVVLVDGSSLSEADLLTYASRDLASFEVPSTWWIRHTALPLNASGKANKTQLRNEWPHARVSAPT
jgi:long-chain acyl-CoA synthetase